MSTEEKEPYFDGPLVTPNTGQNLFYPGPPGMQVPPPAMAAPHPVPQAAPAFYNPQHFAAAAPVNPWQPGLGVQAPPVAQHMNGPQAGDGAAAFPGAQGYFGGVDSSSSASSSQHTSPLHQRHHKVSDDRQSAPHEVSPYSPEASMMYNPQVNREAWSPPSVPNTYSPSRTVEVPPGAAAEPKLPHSDDAPAPIHPPASNFFVPQENNVLQNYMNPVPNDGTPPPALLPNQAENAGNVGFPQQQVLGHVNIPQGMNLNAVDLHNGNPGAAVQDTSDHSYMNMAYTHNYSGAFPPTVQGAGPFVGGFDHDPSTLAIPSTSSQDYDILHSQGSWNEHNHSFLSSQSQPSHGSEVNARVDEPQNQVEDLEHRMEGLDIEGNIETVSTSSGPSDSLKSPEDPESHLPVEQVQQREGDNVEPTPSNQHQEDGKLEEASALPPSDANTGTVPHSTSNLASISHSYSAHSEASSLGNPMVESVSSPANEPEDIMTIELTSREQTVAANMIPHEGSSLSLGYETEPKQPEPVRPISPSYGYDLASLSSAGVHDPESSGVNVHTSQEEGQIQASALQPVDVTVSSHDSTMTLSTTLTSGALLTTTAGTEGIQQNAAFSTLEPSLKHSETPPGSSDSLHPSLSDQSAVLSGAGHDPSQFASSTSAFESRIRSQSTSSNNSTTSSQKSFGSQKNKNITNRQPGPTSYPLQSSTHTEARQATAPLANPFNTNTMHSSHVEDVPQSSSQTVDPIVPAPVIPPPIVSEVSHTPVISSDENLRTGATLPPQSNNPQTLHSQVLRHSTVQSVEPQSSGPPPSLPYVSQAQLHNAGHVAPTSQHPPALETPQYSLPNVSARSEEENRESGPPLPSVANSDPYLSRSLHDTYSSNPASTIAHPRAPADNPHTQAHTNFQTRPNPHGPSTGTAPSSNYDSRSENRPGLPPASVQTQPATDPSPRWSHRDGSEREASSHGPPPESRRHYDDRRQGWDSRDPKREDSRWSGDPRRPDDARDDHKYSQGRRDDQRYRHDYDRDRPGSRQGQEARPRSRQGPPEGASNEYYDDRHYRRDRYDPYYNQHGREDWYYQDRYPGYRGYDRRYYDGYDGRSERYYDQYQRYPDQWHDRRQYDEYYYGDYYRDYPYERREYGEEEDATSVYSERSRVTERDPEHDWHAKQRTSYGYGHDYDYQQEYDQRYYGDSLLDESTLSNAYEESWQRLPTVPARQTPVKFSTTHTIVRFGPGGQLIKVLPNRPTDNQPSTVEIHSLEILLQDTPEAEDLRSYPGPLSKEHTHKNDVLQFTSAQSIESMRNMDLLDRRSTALIWDFLALLVRQNGSVLGTDIAELLTKDLSSDLHLLQSPLEAAKLQRRLQQNRVATPNSMSDDQSGATSPNPELAESSVVTSATAVQQAHAVLEKNCNRFRELLLHGRKKDGLEWAMKSGLWGHALLLASKMDGRTHAQVMLRFANSLPINDPLQTVYQLMSGRQPAAATCVSDEGWGDWRPHLAMILSNPTSSATLDMRAVLTMGDTLSSRGLLHAAHFCYLMSSTPIGYYGQTTTKMVLLGANHMQPFKEFATWDSVRRTEIYEYAVSLGKPHRPGSGGGGTTIPEFQLYKFMYACTLAEYGLVAQAFHYCERIARNVNRTPSSYSATFVSQLLNISERLRYHDPQIQAGTAEPGGLKWLDNLRNVQMQIKHGMIVPHPRNLLTASNTTSIASTTPTSTSPNDEIQFSAHTPDQDDDDDADDEIDAAVHQASPSYGQRQTMPSYETQAVPTYDVSQGQGPGQTMMMVPGTGLPPQQGVQYAGQYGHNEMTQNQVHDAAFSNNQQQQQFMQPVQSGYGQHQQHGAPTGFGELASQANPLVTTQPTSDMMHHQQQANNTYGYNYQQNQVDEEAERNDQVDYYDYMTSMNKHRHPGPEASRSRTVSQSSQRSRGSTLKGYDRTTPTTMLSNHSEKGQRSRTTSENSAGRRSRKTSGEPKQHQQKSKPKEENTDSVKKSNSWSLFGWLSRKKSQQIHLPDDNKKDIVWDNDMQRWVDKNAPEEESAPPGPPPMDDNPSIPMGAPQHMPPGVPQPQAANAPAQPQPLQSAPAGTPNTSLTANRFSLKNLGGNRSMYKNAFSSSSTPVAAPIPPPMMPGMQAPNVPKPTGFLIPNPAATSTPVSDPEPSPAEAATPMHPKTEPSEAIPMFTPGNTPHGSANDFRQPFNHEGSAHNVPSGQNAPFNSNRSDTPPAAPAMFYNPAQFATNSNPLSQPVMAPGQGNAFGKRGRGRPGYPGRR